MKPNTFKSQACRQVLRANERAQARIEALPVRRAGVPPPGRDPPGAAVLAGAADRALPLPHARVPAVRDQRVDHE